MSGSGGGSGYHPSARAQFDCNTGTITTNLSTINLAILSTHSVGDILQVEINATGALVAVNGNGQILGSIVHVNTVDIKQCINNGNNYIAKITVINTPACTVNVRGI
ncbi:hypothetical protein [Sphingobacterium siyangense]|uniref:hypothetical protein n=1 Tax=Sphingobacterium siyangense TaxID=459529 RepID=UPI00289FED7C|nr:hypothetical protein [Sphingobacterium siyangense]